MSQLKLKAFQEEAVTDLVNELSYHLTANVKQPPRLIFQAPTGAGKTVMAGEVLERLFQQHSDVVVLWVSIGTGRLHEQSKEKLRHQLPGDIKVISAEESILGGHTALDGRTIVTVSWQGINTKKGDAWSNVIMRDGEKLNFRQLIHQTQAQRPVLLFIDEAHATAKSKRSKELISTFNPFLILEMSATPEYPEFKKEETCGTWVNFHQKDIFYRGFRVDSKRVSDEGLICRRLLLNDGIKEDVSKTSFELLMDAAYLKHLEIKEGYKPYHINPLLLIQIPNEEAGDRIRRQIEDYFRDRNITIENNRLNIWLTEEHILSGNLTYLNSSVEVLIFKQAINTGWDCPRAKVLVQFRDVKKEETQIQTVGRILRMPEQKHYENELLNSAFVYTDAPKPTFDEDIKTLGVIKDLVSRRNVTLPVPLVSYYHGRKIYNNLVMEDLIEALKDGMARHFNLDFNTYAAKGFNKKQLEDKGVGFSEQLTIGSLLTGSTTTHELNTKHFKRIQVLKDNEQIQIECRSILKTYLRPFGEGDFETNYQTFMSALHCLCENHILTPISTLQIQRHITTYRSTWEACLKDVVNVYREKHEEEADYKDFKYDWTLPNELEFAHEEVETDLFFGRYAYSPSYLLKKRSNPEREFEKALENHPDVIWWYKNGDSGREHLGIGYTTKDGVRKTFYPDYLILTTSDTLWVCETKGYGEANNDENIEEKALALEKFILEHQANNIKIEGAILSPNQSNWYQYQTKTGEAHDSSRCWKRCTLFQK